MSNLPNDSPAPVWVPVDVIIDLHDESITEFGGLPGIRDENSLRSALARPEQILNYEPEADLFRLAGAYATGLTRNHPFFDGNKRMAFLAVGIFLNLNGYYLDETEAKATEMVLALSRKDIEESEFTSWIREMSRPKAQGETQHFE